MKILVLVGSLRGESFSRKLARSAASVAPEGIEFEYTDGGDLPLYDQDLDQEQKPAAVHRLLDQIKEADALLFVSPEFNYGIPGTLKNLIDWASRPAYRSPLKDKPALVITCSVASTGGARAHFQLSSVLNGTLTPLFLVPSFTVAGVHEKFDEAGVLTDDLTRMRLGKTLEDFSAWAGTLKR